MKIRLAKTAGFCMGVRRAMEIALDLQRSNPPLPIVTYGPLIHNPQTLQLLKSRGIGQVDSLEQIEMGTVVIRAHGISPQERRALEEKSAKIIDATCPRVARVQAVIDKHAKKGQPCVIVGDKDHPEVKGLLGFASAGGVVIASADEMDAIANLDGALEVCVVAQTTQEIQALDQVVENLKKRFPSVRVYDTICDSTKKRQAEMSNMAELSDLIVVVGGKGSANTRRLARIAEAHGVRALHIETAEEIPPSVLSGAGVVGVTAGASTPNWQIQRVIDRLKEIGMSRSWGPLRRLRKIFDITVMTYLWTAAGGGGLAAACLTLQRQNVTWLPLVIAMLFVFSMHLLNRIFDRSGAVRFNTPEIAAFYARHQAILSALGVLSSVGAISLGYLGGAYSFAMLTSMILAGLFYTMPLISGDNTTYFRRRSLKEIPGSKTPLVALGWAMAAAVLPIVIVSGTRFHFLGLAVAFIFAAGIIFWRTALSDLMDVQGDRIVGRETIPILLGVKKTRTMLKALLGFLAALPIFSAAAGWTPWGGALLIVNVAIMAMFWTIYKRGRLVDRLLFEGMLDGNLVLAGVVSILYGIE